MDIDLGQAAFVAAPISSIIAVLLAVLFFRLKIKLSRLKRDFTHLVKDHDEARTEIDDLRGKAFDLNRLVGELRAQNHEYSKRYQKEIEYFQANEERLVDKFKAISAESLRVTNTSFLELAENLLIRYRDDAVGRANLTHNELSALVSPIKRSLEKVDEKIQHLEKSREGAYQGLIGQVTNLQEAQSRWQKEAARLSQVLLSPISRGNWGEIQLKRVVELAGMISYCDFFEQKTTIDDDNQRMRPDMVIRLPGGRQIIVDAKSSLSRYTEAMDENNDDICFQKMKLHAEQVRRHVNHLSQKKYWASFETSPEFVILFLPGEHFYSAALKVDPSLIEFSSERKVIVATPTTLIALLKSIAFGWKHEVLEENSREISALGKEMIGRISDYIRHNGAVGRNLKNAVESYNKGLWTLESRLLTTAKKFEKLGVHEHRKPVQSPPEIDVLPKSSRNSHDANSSA